MSRIRYVLAVFVVSARRLAHQPGLAFSLFVGLVAAVALTVSIPIYADAVSYRVLIDRLYNDPNDTAPPFSFLFRYVGSWSGYLEWEALQSIDQYMQTSAAPAIGLAQRTAVRHVKTDRMRLFPAAAGAYESVSNPLAFVSLGFLSDVERHIEIIDGRLPETTSSAGEPIEVLVSTKLVEQTGIQPGEEYIVYSEESPQAGGKVQQPVRIAGVWRPLDPAEDYWFYPQSAFDELLLMPEASYAQMSTGMKGEVGLAVWSLVFDGDGLQASDVDELVGRILTVERQASARLDNLDLARSPRDKLLEFGRTVQFLTVSLFVVGLPIIGLAIYFISLVSGMLVSRQRNEVAMLRSRGTSRWQIVGIYLFEGLIVGGISVVVGVLLGERLAQMMGVTRSFLALGQGTLLSTTLSWANLRYGLVAVVASLLASIGPAFSAARATVVTHKQETARVLRRPFWQRAYLDVLLLLPALYGYYVMRQRGTISFLETEGRAGSPFSNPYLFLVPVLFAFALALFAMRLYPLAMRLLAWLANGWRGSVPVLALRHLARSARHYVGPLLLLVLTLSLAVFTASMARTLDTYAADRSYYEVGSDLRLVEMGESTEGTLSAGLGGEIDGEEQKAVAEGPAWLFLPVSEHLQIPGVRSAARVWESEVTAKLAGGNVEARFMGVDRVDFGQVAFFRSDFAPASFGALMNALAVRDDAVLVSRDLYEQGLEVGDTVQIQLPLGDKPTVRFTVGGVVDLFPRLYPEDGSFFVGNLAYVFDHLGATYPYDVWLRTEPTVTVDAVLKGTDEMGIDVMRTDDAREMIDLTRVSPERQGMFGLLSVGFIAAALLTVIGFLIYSYISYLQRYIELGVLRAIGLSVSQMAAFLAAEQLTLIATGAAVGTGLGVLVSRLFIPFFQVQSGEHPFTPPFIVQVAWDQLLYIYAVFGVMFVAGVLVLYLSLRRMRIFEAVKLGEAT
jgi:putative ABC transport system permease protein